MNEVKNPFFLSGYRGADYFCDRKIETNLLCQNFKNGINTTLLAIRRLGKTGLIYHVFEQLNKSRNVACIYVDIYTTTTLKEFTNTLATAIYNRFPEKKGIGKKIIEAIQALRPVISYDSLSGNPEVSLEFSQPKQYEKTIQQLFQFLDAQNIKVVIAIDEFQQILEYPEKNVESVLRTYIQPLKNINFIFCGSNQKMMHELFNNSKRPFYASCSNMHLNAIEAKEYSPFIKAHFVTYKRTISNECIAYILEWTQMHTFYTQYICNKIFASGIKKIELASIYSICNQTLLENENTYYQYRNLLTTPQWKLLRAIAKEEKAEKLHTKDFLKRYDLGTTSTISRSIEALLEKEMVYIFNHETHSHYAVYDKFLMRWLQHK